MSVIIKHNGVIKMYVKGADSIIKKRLAPEQIYMDMLDRYLNTFAVKGLRTLLLGEKLLSQQEYDEFREAESRLPEEGRGKLKD
jgi:magnesium-transporting ATPase (P-type)